MHHVVMNPGAREPWSLAEPPVEPLPEVPTESVTVEAGDGGPEKSLCSLTGLLEEARHGRRIQGVDQRSRQLGPDELDESRNLRS